MELAIGLKGEDLDLEALAEHPDLRGFLVTKEDGSYSLRIVESNLQIYDDRLL